MSRDLDEPRADNVDTGYAPKNYPTGGDQSGGGGSTPPNRPPVNPPPPDTRTAATMQALADAAKAIATIAVASIPDVVNKIPPTKAEAEAMKAGGLDPFNESTWKTETVPPALKTDLVEGKFFEKKDTTQYILNQTLVEMINERHLREMEIAVRVNELVDRVNYLMTLVMPPIIDPTKVGIPTSATTPLTKI
jgi:hypothetical protein